MKIYNIYTNKKSPIEDAIFINKDFNLMASIFHLFWFLFNKIWLISTLLIIIIAIIIFFRKNHLIDEVSSLYIFCFISFISGYYGNDFYAASLKSRGYVLNDVICSDNIEKARYRYFAKYLKK